MAAMDPRSEVREFLSSRRARITPEQAGLPAYGGNRRVEGLRREEVAMLAGVSVDYYVRMERGNLAGASDSVLDALASALQLDEAEREHLYALARESGTGSSRRRRRTPGTVRPALQQVLDAITDAPAWIRNGRHDVLAMNQLARALYAPVLADPRRPANTARFVYLNPEAAEQFFVDYDKITRDAAAMLRMEAGQNPHDEDLIALVGELSTRSELFRQAVGVSGRALPPVRPQAAAAPRRRSARPGLRGDAAAVRPRPPAQHLHRGGRHAHRRRAQAAGVVGGQPRQPCHRTVRSQRLSRSTVGHAGPLISPAP